MLAAAQQQRVVGGVRGSLRRFPAGLAGRQAAQPRRGAGVRVQIAAPMEPSTSAPLTDERGFRLNADGTYDLSAAPPFGLSDIRDAIPKHCWEKNSARSMAYLALDVAIVAGLAVGAYTLNAWWAWPFYWLAQGTMFWALFVVGHDCGHQSFSNNRHLNDLVGNITHASILVPYHGWRISHRKHHGNHGHVENDESWHPTTKTHLEEMEPLGRLGRLKFPWPIFAFPFYLWARSPGKTGSHYDPNCDLFQPSERRMVLTSDAFMVGMLGVLAAATAKLGFLSVLNLYVLPYWMFVAWLDVVTYLHHHGTDEKMPWYRGEQWSYLRGGLTTLDQDYGIFNKIHHDIGTHVVHHLFPQMPHYHLEEATAKAKEVMGPYYREPQPSPGPLPTHLWGLLKRSFERDHYVDDTGDIVYYKSDPRITPQ